MTPPNYVDRTAVLTLEDALDEIAAQYFESLPASERAGLDWSVIANELQAQVWSKIDGHLEASRSAQTYRESYAAV